MQRFVSRKPHNSDNQEYHKNEYDSKVSSLLLLLRIIVKYTTAVSFSINLFIIPQVHFNLWPSIITFWFHKHRIIT